MTPKPLHDLAPLDWVLWPAAALMRRLGFVPKSALLAAIFLVPLAIVLAGYEGHARAQIAVAARERDGLRFIASASAVVRSVQVFRGTSNAFAESAHRPDRDLVDDARRDVRRALRDLLTAASPRNSNLGLSVRVREEIGVWNRLVERRARMTPRERFAEDTVRIDAMIDLIEDAADGSSLTLDGSLETHQLGNLMVKRVLQTGEALAVLRGRQAGEIAHGASGGELERRADWKLARRNLVLTGRALHIVARARPDLDPRIAREWTKVESGANAVEPLAALGYGPELRARLGTNDRHEAAHRLFARYSVLVDGLYRLNAAANAETARLIDARAESQRRARTQLLGATAAALALGLYLWLGFIRGSRLLIGTLEDASRRMERGETPDAVAIHSRDELALVAEAFNRVFRKQLDHVARLNDTVAERTAELSARARELEASHAALDERGRALERALDGVARLDCEGKIQSTNPAFVGIFGLEAARAGTPWLDLFAQVGRKRLGDLCDAIGGSATDEITTEALRPDGEPFVAEILLVGCLDPQGDPNGAYLLVRDVSERAAYEARIAHMAFHDGLTGLPNRASFQEALRERLLDPEPPGVMFLDLDGFKAVNDALGHEAGDAVLRTVAERAERMLIGVGTIARLAGDEFAVLLRPEVTPGEALELGDRLIGAIERPIPIALDLARVSASIGVAYARRAEPLDALLHRADAAMYRGKRLGKGACVLDEDLPKAA